MTGKKLVTDTRLYTHDPVIHNLSAAREVLPYILKLIDIHTILDVGCGTGTWLSAAKELGIREVTGIDGVRLEETALKIPVADFIHANIAEKFTLKKRFDLVICLEVAEHLPETATRNLINTLTDHGDFILFSAAIPGQGGQNHLNEQWPEYWANLFLDKGYFACDILRNQFWDNEKVEWWYRQNLLIFASEKTVHLLDLQKTEKVRSLVHPQLFEEKLAEIHEQQLLIQKEIWSPTLKRSLKSLFKSVFK